MKTITLLVSGFLAFSSPLFAADRNLRAVADLNNPSIYEQPFPYTYPTIRVPLADSIGSSFVVGDRLSLDVSFANDQRLELTSSPITDIIHPDVETFRFHVYDVALRSDVNGQSRATLTLVDPSGDFSLATATIFSSFAASQGALTGMPLDWTDSTFSVAGFRLEVEIVQLSQPVLPNEILIEFRNFQIQPIPEPRVWALGLLMVCAAFAGRCFQRRLSREGPNLFAVLRSPTSGHRPDTRRSRDDSGAIELANGGARSRCPRLGEVYQLGLNLNCLTFGVAREMN